MKHSILPAFLLSLAPALLAQADTVILRNGTVETGRIESEDYDVLRFKIKKGKDDLPATSLQWADIAEIKYGVVEFQQAIAQLNSGNRGAALPRLQALLAQTSLRKELKPAVAFQFGCGQLRSGQLPEAAATLLELVKSSPKSRYVIPATRALVEVYLATADLTGGTTAIDAATAAAKEAGANPNQLLAFDYFRGLLHEAKKDFVNAKVCFQTASRAEQGAAAIGELATLALARVNDADGKAEDARTAYRGIIDRARGNEVLAGAWSGLAKRALLDGVTARNAEKVTDALFMYLRGVVAYAPAPGEGTTEYERALAGAAEAFKHLADLETDETLKKQHANRSRQRLDQLRKEFPHSAHLPK